MYLVLAINSSYECSSTMDDGYYICGVGRAIAKTNMLHFDNEMINPILKKDHLGGWTRGGSSRRTFALNVTNDGILL